MDDQVHYRNMKGWISQNVMCDVSFDMRFNYVLAGWEGSASNSRILQDAIYRRPLNRLKVPVGNALFNYNHLFCIYTLFYIF